MILNNVGKIIQTVWQSLPKHHPVKLDTFQIMPNHVHAIIHLVGVSFMKPVYSKSKTPIDVLKSNRHMGLINQTQKLSYKTLLIILAFLLIPII
ncbi:hypothetical protein KJ909_01335 [Patescibacteria group bacterium]|nr:hypothetical protein [Patescibacteria group bacterium]